VRSPPSRGLWAGLTLVVLSGCVGVASPGPGADAGDGGVPDAGFDAGALPDAGTPSDAGPEDAGAQVDGGQDAGPRSDGGQPDAGDVPVWAPLAVMAVTTPVQFGAVGDGVANDQAALEAAIAALPPDGGILYLPAGKTFRKTGLLTITKHHVKVWAPDGQATLLGSIQGQQRHQSTICSHTVGCGFFGVRFTSDAVARFDAAEDNQVTLIAASDSELVGCEVDNSAATGFFVYQASLRTFVQGNSVHHTWADTIHFTDGSRTAWVWDNQLYNQGANRGDDGIACVTYGPTSAKCGDMEWWHNEHLGGAWGRGYSVIGGDHISIHHNFARETAGAGVIVASEPSYDSATSTDIDIHDNAIFRAAQSIGHPGILISALNTPAGPIERIALADNAVVDTATGEAFRTEGTVANVTNVRLSTDAGSLPSPLPAWVGPRTRSTAVLQTRDSSFVPPGFRPGLYRIDVRRAATGTGYEQRFEYLVAGQPAALATWLTAQPHAVVVASQVVGAETVAIVHSAQPLPLSVTLRGVTFDELRAGDRAGSLRWAWSLLEG